ncbi:plasmid recombination protein [Anaerocolumna aminovalerica]|uniref:plasmid recombination protein n=1 Tax=Anaerocolumna aminovalerica TaxID=1527 RepID=UPI001C0EB461|nr:plasmid recombination protein [Anaerocolumna aminovalerica]MBU5334270.1 plasmid recombination protein [Anaerocolumna aminovalerica]
MEGISFTAHVSNKKSAITSKSKLAGVAKHNLRKYKSEEYSADNIFLIYGTDNLVHDVKAVYHQEFDEAVKVYNENQSRADRKIEDYFEHVANKEQDMAVEIIIQVGDRAYWQEHCENKVFMRRIYRMLLEELQYQLPQFVVANAVVHMDEDSPHMHVVGVPVGTGYKNGMSKQVSKRKVFTKEVLSIVLQDKLRAFANQKAEIVLGEQIREKSKGRNYDLSVMEYKVLKEEIRYDDLKEQADEKQQENQMLEREKKQLVQEYDTLSMRVAVKQMDYEEADKRVKEANERADRIEAYIKTQSDTLVDLEEKTTKLERKAEIAEMVYEMARGSGGNEDLRDKLIDVMYENEQLKAENSKLRETLNKAYDFMKQFVVDGRNLLERFLESIGQVIEKVRDGFRR